MIDTNAQAANIVELETQPTYRHDQPNAIVFEDGSFIINDHTPRIVRKAERLSRRINRLAEAGRFNRIDQIIDRQRDLLTGL